MNKLAIIRPVGLISYEEGLRLQEMAFDLMRSESEYAGILIMLEHRPVFTYGSDGGSENLLVDKSSLLEKGIELFETRRGGNITYHGKGQITGYPVIDMKRFRADAHWYIRSIEEVIIRYLGGLGIQAQRKKEYPGVWVDDKKMAAIGVKMRRWVTTHGFAFNVSTDLDNFTLINPCGITEYGVSNLSQYKDIDIEAAREGLIESFMEVFPADYTDMDIKELEKLWKNLRG